MTDLRVCMSAVDFDGIPVDSEDPIDGYHECLLSKEFWNEYDRFGTRGQTSEFLPQLTTGQRMLLVLGTLDGQVKNGGLTQFFWNYPEYIFEARDAIEILDESELLKNYEAALELLVGNKDHWFELREKSFADWTAPDWEPFRQSYELLNLSWFDNAYFDQRGENDSGQWVKLSDGLGIRLMRKLADYVRSHKSEFVVDI
jgi:hypothetical protein